jgi:hypothetical protein
VKHSYILNVGDPIETTYGFVWRHKETGKIHTGWFHCGFCQEDGLGSVGVPVCTRCANTVRFGGSDQQKIYNYLIDIGMNKDALDKFVKDGY